MTSSNFTQPAIAALSTPPAKGGVAIIRISGLGACEIADGVFFPMSGRRLSESPARAQVYGYIKNKEEILDDCLATRFDAGHSYTGEETVEFSIHGSPLLAKAVLELLFSNGARPAMAGEFTRRAFLSGRLSLTEAEGIGSLIDATNREQIRLAAPKARGILAEAISSLRRELTSVLSEMLVRIDYPEEDLGDLTDEELGAKIEKILTRLSSLISSYRTGRAIAEGIPTVIIGKPNAGKSTVYNLLLGEEAAIVTDIAGTTRDLLERTTTLGRVTLRLTDTAGIRGTDPSDPVEMIGIERGISRAEEAELVIVVLDLSREPDGDDERVIALAKELSGTKICILNKDDEQASDGEGLSHLVSKAGFARVIKGSARKDGERLLSELSGVAEELLTDGDITPDKTAIVSSARQHAALLSCKECTEAARDALLSPTLRDAVASELSRALSALGEVDGHSVSEEVVADIFSRFCVGK